MHVFYQPAISIVRMRRNRVNSASGLKHALTIGFSDHNFYTWATSGVQTELAIRFGDLDFIAD